MTTHTAVFLTLALTLAGGAAAQQQPVAASPCAGGRTPVGHLGYDRLSCNCTFYYDESNPEAAEWRFRGEPRIEGVRRGGPGDGKLRPGDLIVAIDGVLITSVEGGRRFARVQPGRPVRLTIRRDGREHHVTITPEATCPPEAPVAPRAPSAMGPPGLPGVPNPPVPTRAPPSETPPLPPPPGTIGRGWFGFSIVCSRCGIQYEGDRPVWTFTEPPVIEQIEPGTPAARAGLRDGDRIIAVDDIPITAAEGGERFGAVEPGEQVRFLVERHGGTRAVTLTAGGLGPADQAPDAPDAPPPSGIPHPDVVRFDGVLGDALIQVTGGPITVTHTEDLIVIRSADITVRIRRTRSEPF